MNGPLRLLYVCFRGNGDRDGDGLGYGDLRPSTNLDSRNVRRMPSTALDMVHTTCGSPSGTTLAKVASNPFDFFLNKRYIQAIYDILFSRILVTNLPNSPA
jgi:hypothetical protein